VLESAIQPVELHPPFSTRNLPHHHHHITTAPIIAIKQQDMVTQGMQAVVSALRGRSAEADSLPEPQVIPISPAFPGRSIIPPAVGASAGAVAPGGVGVTTVPLEALPAMIGQPAADQVAAAVQSAAAARAGALSYGAITPEPLVQQAEGGGDGGGRAAAAKAPFVNCLKKPRAVACALAAGAGKGRG